MAQFTFTRRALNASYSNRTAKIGKPQRNKTTQEVLRYAYELSKTEGEVTIQMDGKPFGSISRFRYNNSTNGLVQIIITEDEFFL